MKVLFRDAIKLTEELRYECDKLHDELTIYASSGRPSERKKVSITNLNSAFNEKIQADFIVAYIMGEN